MSPGSEWPISSGWGTSWGAHGAIATRDAADAALQAAEAGQPYDPASIAASPIAGWVEYASLRRNIDVTAGVRYKTPDRDRLAPMPDDRRVDSQAVYVGTTFRF